MTQEEIRRRIDRLADHANSLGLDGVLVHSWRRNVTTYFTGYTPGYFTNQAGMWVGANGETDFGVKFPYDLERAEVSAAGALTPRHVMSPAELVPTTAQRIGIVAGDHWVSELNTHLTLRLRGQGVTEIVDVHREVDEWRSKKSPVERALLTRAAQIGDAALRAAGDAVRLGATDFVVAAAAEGTARAAGASGSLCLVGIGAGKTITEPHGRVVEAATDPVGLELTLYVEGHVAHVNATFFIEASEHSQAYAVMRAARERIAAAMIPGTAIADVVAAGDAVLAEADLLDAKEYDFGHGIGFDTPEHPVLQPQIARHIEVDNVISIHVGVRRPDGATACIGGPVVITEAGAEELVPTALWIGQV